MDYPVSMQQVLREILKQKVEKYGRDEVARRLDCSLTALDFLRNGFSKVLDKETGEYKIQPRYISFEHIEMLARADDISYAEMIKNVYLATVALELDARPETSEEYQPQRSESDDRK